MAVTPVPSGPPTKLEDSQLISGLARRDESALRLLIDVHGPHVFAKTLQILRNPELAEEAAQDTLLVLWWEPTRFDAFRGSLRSFLVGVARFKAIDVVRHEESARTRDVLATAEDVLIAPSGATAVEDAMVVRDAISQLPESKREVIFLAYFRGLTYREVSNALGIPEGTVKTRIRSSLISLRAIMALGETA